MKNSFLASVAMGTVLIAGSVPANAVSVLWFDSTPEYSGQAPNSLRMEMSDYLNSFDGGGTFTSTYIGSETAGALATALASNTYDVLVFDSTSSSSKFNAADLLAVQNFYASGKNNLLFDGNLYVRSINFNSTTDFPGINESTGGLTVNEVWALGSRGGGIMVGTDHNCCQGDANQIVQAILPGAGFSGNVSPSADGQYNGTELLSVQAAVSPADLLAHYSSVPSQGIAPTGIFTDFLGNEVELFSQLDIAGTPGGPKNSFISTSFAPGGGIVDVDDPDPPPMNGAVPEPGTWMLMLLGFFGIGAMMRRRKGNVTTTVSYA